MVLMLYNEVMKEFGHLCEGRELGASDLSILLFAPSLQLDTYMRYCGVGCQGMSWLVLRYLFCIFRSAIHCLYLFIRVVLLMVYQCVMEKSR
jgi:hypothetical protein